MHDSLFYKLQKAYLIMEKEIPSQWYHGSPTPISKFSDDFVGNGVDQEGPGIYFTSNEEDAAGYARKSEHSDGAIYVVQLNFRKLVPLKGKPNKKELIQLIDWSPNLDVVLTNWDEDPKKAKLIALNTILKEKNPHEAFKTIWFEFYRHDPIEYVRNLVTLGYDGVVVPKSFMNTKHAVVYNTKIINVIDKY